MKPKIFLKNIEFSDGTLLEFDKNDLTVIVGPNNSGKSATLKELNRLTRKDNGTGVVIKGFHLSKSGSSEEMLSFLEESSIVDFGDGTVPYYRGFNYGIYKNYSNQYWEEVNSLNNLHPIFINLLTTGERLTLANPPDQISLTTEAYKHPIHFIQKDDSIEFKFSKYFKQAFNQDLIVHRNAGKQVPLYVGSRPIPSEGQDRTSIEYLKELEKLPLLHEQGDGMRSFVGILLSAFISKFDILLLDEPEAFLHPPQARLLGKMLGKDLPKDKQLFLSTHSSDFLKGLIDANIENLRILRLEREGDVNKVSVLNNDDIKEVWSDSLLRHSNILDGLFHSKVVICESDSDCRFYSSVLQSIFEDDDNISPDILFIHCGGKHRINIVQKALIKLNVKINVIADFDILNDTNPLKSIYEEAGGDWLDIKNDWKIVKDSIDSKRPEMETIDIKLEITNLLNSISDRIFPKSGANKINSILRKASPWSHAKQVGKAFVPSGNPTQSYQRLINKLEELGILVVEEGELESFVKSVGNHGPKWVNQVLSKDLANDSELLIARTFVKKLI